MSSQRRKKRDEGGERAAHSHIPDYFTMMRRIEPPVQRKVPIRRSDLRSAASSLVKVHKEGGASLQEHSPPVYSSEEGGKTRAAVMAEDDRSVLPLEAERWECGASGQPGPWGPAGLRSSA